VSLGLSLVANDTAVDDLCDQALYPWEGVALLGLLECLRFSHVASDPCFVGLADILPSDLVTVDVRFLVKLQFRVFFLITVNSFGRKGRYA
jgi:hypothetical protein